MNLQDALQKKMDRRKKKDAKDTVTLDKGQGDLLQVTPPTHHILTPGPAPALLQTVYPPHT